MKRRWEVLAYVLLVAGAIAVRVIGLADRPFHHDESQDAYFSWLFWQRGDYQYQPILHGPLRFYLTAFNYVLFGDTDFTARLAPVVMGTLMVPLPALLRGQIGRVGAFAAATALAFGPSFLYYSRFAREDIYVACITLALLVVTFRFLQRPRRHQPALIGILLALSFATKESTFITVFVAGTFFLVALAVQARRHGFREAPIVAAVRAVGWEAWIWGVVAFVAVFTVLFTVFLTNPAGLWDGIHDGIAYWLDQHETGGRGEKEWWFYIVVLFAEEWPALLLGLVGAIVTIRRPTLLRAFLIWDFLLSLALYSYASERFSWLVLHPLLPLLLLAGVGVQAIWDARAALGREARPRRRRAVRRLRGLHVVVGERGERRGPARVPRHHAVGGGRQGGARPGRGGRGARPPRGPLAEHPHRLGRGRDVPVGVVLPRPPGRLPGHDGRAAAVRHRRGDPHRGQPQPAAARPGRLRRPPVPVPRLVGARLRRDVGRRLVALDDRARAVEPDGRDARVDLRPAGCVSAIARSRPRRS